jgi:NAD+ synthase (glutamine-hydrolysing)
MQLIKLAAAALNQTPLDWAGNRDNILRAIEEARNVGVSVLCLPELCVSGYGCEDAFHSPGIIRTALEILQEIASQTREVLVAIGVPVRHHGGLYNAACLATGGEILGFVCKQHLAGDGIHYEPRWFRRWSPGAVAQIELGDRTYPIGDLLFDCGGVRIGFEICEDAWVADRPGARLAQRGVDVILNPSASHFAFAKQAIRERFVLEGSRAFHASYVLANLVGNEAGRAIYDGSTLVASGGTLLATGPRFSYKQVVLTSAVVDVDATRMSRARSGIDPDEAATASGGTVPVAFTLERSGLSALAAPSRAMQMANWEAGPYQKEEEFARAVPLALFDYLRKTGSQGFVVSLSGGADSATVAVLAWLMVRFALAEIGEEGVKSLLSYMRLSAADAEPSRLQSAAVANGSGLNEGNDWPLVRRLLACVYQSTANSTDTTRTAARDVAKGIGAEFLELDVDQIVLDYRRIVSEAIGRELNWETDDVALQNIQARARGPSVWLLANLRSALLLTTSNRSEAAVGYATMDGDTCGGLAPIAGIDKAFLRRWLAWMESNGPQGIGPLPALASVNAQKPTAELRPPAAGQTDEADLMPYDVLDAIERAAIRDKLVPVEVLRVVRPLFLQYEEVEVTAWIDRFFRLWCRNQWKRERYAPSFHLDDENLDPKTWCRFPILSGGYERELLALQETVVADATAHSDDSTA